MNIHIQLYSILREKLPSEARGRATMQFDEGASLSDVLDKLEISQRVVISVNGKNETDHSYKLQDGDEVKIFSSISGGVNNLI